MSQPRRFTLERYRDISGVSGVGTVAWGIEWPDGVVALHWMGAWPTSVVFYERGMAAVTHIHGHDGATQIVYVDVSEEDSNGPL